MSSWRSTVQAQISDLDHQLLTRDLEIAATQAHIREAEAGLRTSIAQRAEMSHQRAQLAAKLAPVSNVPYEILSMIFLMANEREEEPEYRDDPWEDDGLPLRDPFLFPMVASRVNRHFRHVATTTAALWAFIQVRDRTSITRLKLWMERSKACLLDIDIDLSEHDSDWDASQPHHNLPNVRAVMKVIKPPHRWRSLRLRVATYEVMHAALLHCSGQAPHLRELELAIPGITYVGPTFRPREMKEPVNIFKGSAPHLTCVRLNGVHLAWQHPMLSALTELHLLYHTTDVRPTTEQYMQLLQNSPRLKKLVFMASGPRVESSQHAQDLPVPPTCVQLDALEELGIGDIPARVISYILSSMNTPSLKALSLDAWEGHGYKRALKSIRKDSRTRYPALTKLRMTCVDCKDFPGFIRGFPGVEQLELNIADQFLEALIMQDRVRRDGLHKWRLLLPNLRCLRTIGYAGDVLRRFVEQRKRLGAGLTKVLVQREDVIGLTDENELRRLVTTFGYFRGTERDDADEDDSGGESYDSFDPYGLGYDPYDEDMAW